MKKLHLLALFMIHFTLSGQVVINEFSAANFNTFTDQFGDDSDWIELYNSGSSPVNISGYHLSDRFAKPMKWEIPSGTIIDAGQYMLFWASGKDLSGAEMHTNFKITQTNGIEAVLFTDPSGTIIDSHDLDIPNKTNNSWARTTDGSGDWGVSLNPTPGSENDNIFNGYAATPDIEPSAGFFNGSVQVSILISDPQATIYYTTDGSEPDNTDNQYTGPFDVNSTTVIRAIAYSPSADLESFIETNTYFVNSDHTLKVLSIAGGDALSELMDGSFNEPVGSLEYFGKDGLKRDEAVGEFNKHGNDSWAYPQRGIDFIVRDQFGYDSDVDDQIFGRKDRDEFQRLILKAGANDNYPFEFGGAHIRDAFVHTLSQEADMEMDERTYEPCIIYINGEYWGVYEIREKVDDHDYTKYYYNQGKQWIDFIKTWGGTWEEYGSSVEWYELRDYIENNDLTIQDNYDYVAERLNLESLIDYIILHSWNVSSDWLNWNTGWWRGRKPDGDAQKWRYILWDEDATFGHYINYSNVPTQDPDADPCDPEEIGDGVDFEGHVGIFQALFENDEFLAKYINRYADLNNSYFSCEYVIPFLDSLIAQIEPEMQAHIDRWGGSYSEWQDNVGSLKDFIETRCTLLDDGIVDCYEDEGITGPYDVLIKVDPPNSGKVRANTVVGSNYPWESTYFGGIELELEGIPNIGNQFWYWEVSNNTFGPSQMDAVIQMSLETGDEIIAHFVEGAPCGAPTSLMNDSLMTSVNLEWSGSFGAVGYEVQYREEGTADWTIFATLDPETPIQNLNACTTYDLRIRTVCETTLSEYSEFSFKTACSTSTTDLNATGISNVNIYPNPFNQEFNLELELDDVEFVQIIITDLAGKQYVNYQESNLKLGSFKKKFTSLERMTGGFYSIQIITDKGISGFPILKTR